VGTAAHIIGHFYSGAHDRADAVVMADLTCVLCGRPADQLGRFCIGCVGAQGPASAPRWGRSVHVGEARVNVLRTLRWPLVVLLLAGVGVSGVRAGESWLAARDLQRVVGHVALGVHDPRITSLVHLERSLSILQLGTTVAIGVVFLAWWSLAYRNLGALGIHRRNPTSWAVASWFVPVVSLVAPKRVAEELRQGSDAGTPLGWSYRRGAMSALVTAWWASWVVSIALPPAALAGVSAAVTARPDLLGPIVVASGAAFVLSAVLLGVAGLCAVVLVGEVTAAQIDRAGALADAGLA
jgi:hypothetical protein